MILSQIENQVRKLEDVIEIKLLKDGESVFRELIMIKIRVTAAQRGEINSMAARESFVYWYWIDFIGSIAENS